MRMEIVKKEVQLSDDFRAFVEKKREKLEQLLEGWQNENLFLRVGLEKVGNKNTYQCRLILDLPSKTLQSKKQAGDLNSAATEAFNALFREVEKYKAKIRGETNYRRKRPKMTIRTFLAEVPLKTEIHESFATLLEEIFPKLYRFTVRELQNKIYQKKIKTKEITVRDILDEAIVRVSRDLKSSFNRYEVRRKLYRTVIEVINQLTAEKTIRTLPLEKVVRYEDVDEEFFEFFQPDDIVKVEDLLPAEANSEEREALQLTIDHILSQLPDEWRQAFRLIELDGFSLEEVAMIQNRSVQEVKDEVEAARQKIQQELQKAGFAWQS